MGPTFDAVYDAHFDFVYRSLRRLGIAESAAEDVAQEVFVIVHRTLADFEGRSALRTWLYGIARNVAHRHRRASGRRIATLGDDAAIDEVGDDRARSPDEGLARAEATRALDAMLDELDDEKREVFVLVELEELSVPEAAEAIGINANTAYTRLRAARRQFEAALARHRARTGMR